jgi:peptide-methionine (S)-S-oxide reductase
MNKLGFGGGCHWCTEAVFQALKGVAKVEQGWIASNGMHTTFSEAVIVHFDPAVIDMATLTAIHLYTHSCTSQHPMRAKYRSAVYTFFDEQTVLINSALSELQADFDEPIITQVLPFKSFKENEEQYQNYYRKHADKQFCTNYIHPKLQLLRQQFSEHYEGV